MSDLRQAWRMLGRMPGLSAVVIISLGVGIGVNTAVFSWIQAMVLQPIPGVAGVSTVQTALRSGARTAGRNPMRNWLMAIEVACGVAGAGGGQRGVRALVPGGR